MGQPLSVSANGGPLVSVCVPMFNGERYLPEALGCVLAQSYANIEVVISDDCSTDGSLAIAERFADESGLPTKVLRHKRKSLADNWNHCVENSNGKFIKFLFQDDLMVSDCIARMVEVAESAPRVVLVFCPRRMLIEANALDDTGAVNIFKNYSVLHNDWTDLKPLQRGDSLLADPNLVTKGALNKIGEPSTVLLDRATLLEIGGFDSRLKQIVDVDAWWRLFAAGCVAFIDEPLASFRVHIEQTSVHFHKSGSHAREFVRFASKVLKGPLRERMHPNSVWMLRHQLGKQGWRGTLLAWSDRLTSRIRSYRRSVDNGRDRTGG